MTADEEGRLFILSAPSVSAVREWTEKQRDVVLLSRVSDGKDYLENTQARNNSLDKDNAFEIALSATFNGSLSVIVIKRTTLFSPLHTDRNLSLPFPASI